MTANTSYRARLLAVRLLVSELSMGSTMAQAVDEATFTSTCHPDWLLGQSSIQLLASTKTWDDFFALADALTHADAEALGIQR